jgi:hypothetical protein
MTSAHFRASGFTAKRRGSRTIEVGRADAPTPEQEERDIVDVNPCDPSQQVEVTTSDTGVIHFMLFADGTVHITGTIRSTISVDVLPTDGTPDATGHGVTWFGTNGKIDPDTGEAFGKGESTFTTSVHVTFTDGARISFHEVAHVLFDANGVVKVEFDKFKAHCG